MNFLDGWTLDIRKIPKYEDITGHIFTEQVDVTLLNMMNKKSSEKIEINNHKNNITIVLDNVNKKTGQLQVQYTSNYNGLGDLTPVNNISMLCSGDRTVRHTMFEYMGYKEIDINKAFITLMYEISLKNGILLSSMKNYITNYEEITDDIISYYKSYGINLVLKNKPKNDLVRHFLNCIYSGGTYKDFFVGNSNLLFKSPFGSSIEKNCLAKSTGIIERLNLSIKTIPPPHPFFENFIKEFNIFKKYVVDNNFHLMAYVDKKCPTINQNLKEIALVQIYRDTFIFNATANAYSFLVRHNVIPPYSALLQNDSIIIPPIHPQINMNQLSDQLNAYIYAKTGFHFVYKYKPWDMYSKKLIEERNNPWYVVWFNIQPLFRHA